MKVHSILICILITLCGRTFGQSSMNFHTINVKSGISDNYIQCIINDKYGFMWFATCNGLNRYDGYHFKQYNAAPSGSYDNNLDWISEDAEGNIWVKSPNFYFIYDRKEDRLKKDINQQLATKGIYGEIKQLFIDENKNIWCLNRDTLYNYNFSIKELSRFDVKKYGEIKSITSRNHEAYILFTNGNINKINLKEKKITKETSIELSKGFHPRIYLDNAHNIWFYITHGSRINCYSTEKKEWIDFPGKDEIQKQENNITIVTDDAKGNIWIGTDNNGIYISHISKNNFSHIHKESNMIYSLPSNHITYFMKDDNDIMWIGTSKNGVCYTCLNKMNFDNILLDSNEDVSCILKDEDNNIWLGFDGEGLMKINRKQDTTQKYNIKNSNLPSQLIVSSFMDSKKRIWWGTFGGGAFFFKDGKFHDCNSLIKNHIKISNYIRKIVEDEEGNLWLSSYVDGLYMISSSGNAKIYDMNNCIFSNKYIADISCKNGSNLYIATGDGLYCMNIFTKKIELISRIKNVNCIYEDSKGLLWIGGREGLAIYNIKSNDTKNLNTSNGLSNNYIRAIAEDKDRNIWVSTDHGITHILPSFDSDGSYDFRCFPYYEKDGIRDFTFNNFSILCDDENIITIGGSGGYVQFKANSEESVYKHKHVVFTELYIGNKSIKVNEKNSDGREILSKNIQLSKDITLDYSDVNFTIEVSAMEYENLHKLQYAYRLSEDEKWVRLEGNKIYFNKLSPGTHKLQVKVFDYRNTKNPVSELIVNIKPPLWMSTEAYILYIIIILFAIADILYFMRKKHLRILKEQKREMEIKKQHEMDETKMRFFTNISHDLKTPLSLIITPIERLLSNNTIAPYKSTLEIVYRNSIILKNEIDQLLDFRKMDMDKQTLNLSYGNICDFIKETCSTVDILLEKNELQFRLNMEDENVETYFDKNKMKRIILNLLSNAIKYNNPNGSISIHTYNLPNNPKMFCVEVADTGIGVKDENKERIFNRYYQENKGCTNFIGSGIGLHIVKEYVTLHGGSIEIKDNKPVGSVFSFTIPITSKIEEDLDHKELSCDTNKKNILLVDDNEDFRKFLTDCLKDKYNIFEAENGVKALEILEKKDMNLVVSDIMMPIMNGLELCRKIKNNINLSHIPIILLTAKTEEEHILNGLKEGADDYITKPFNMDILLIRIEKLITLIEENHKKFKTIDISPSEITISNPDEELIKKAISIVEKNIDNSSFSVEELSENLNMTRGHLYKKLMAITGKSPVEFIRLIRIKRGYQLIEKGYMNISQISYQIGFSPQLFTKYFKEEYGITPSEFWRSKTINVPQE